MIATESELDRITHGGVADDFDVASAVAEAHFEQSARRSESPPTETTPSAAPDAELIQRARFRAATVITSSQIAGFHGLLHNRHRDYTLLRLSFNTELRRKMGVRMSVYGLKVGIPFTRGNARIYPNRQSSPKPRAKTPADAPPQTPRIPRRLHRRNSAGRVDCLCARARDFVMPAGAATVSNFSRPGRSLGPRCGSVSPWGCFCWCLLHIRLDIFSFQGFFTPRLSLIPIPPALSRPSAIFSSMTTAHKIFYRDTVGVSGAIWPSPRLCAHH